MYCISNSPFNLVKVLNCGNGHGFVAILDVMRNCGQMCLQLWLHCSHGDPKNLYNMVVIRVAYRFLKPCTWCISGSL